MVKGTTKSGFRFSVDEAVFTSWEFMRAVRDVQQEDQLKATNGIVDLVELALGKEQTQRLARYLARGAKTVSSEAVLREYAEIVEIVKGVKASKN